MNENLLFLDTETTGLEAEDRLCQVAYQFGGMNNSQFFKPPVPIKVGAMAVSHITNKMVENEEIFPGSTTQGELFDLVDSHILVAHNAPFDLAMLEKEGVSFARSIDTKKMSHAADPDQLMESHRLQYLRYYYDVELPEAVAHSAEGDVAVLIAVFEKLRELLGNPSVEELIELSARPILFKRFNFGKYKGNDISSIAAVNPGYLEWMLKEKQVSGQNETDWIYTLKHYLNN